jgi:hypothetical protein
VCFVCVFAHEVHLSASGLPPPTMLCVRTQCVNWNSKRCFSLIMCLTPEAHTRAILQDTHVRANVHTMCDLGQQNVFLSYYVFYP